MNIGIEATSAAELRKTGVGYYTYHLIRAMALLRNKNHTCTLYLRHPFSDLPISPERTTAHSPKFVSNVFKSPCFWAQLRLPVELWSHPQDVYFFPSSVLPLLYQPEQSVITVHDVAFLFFPECFSPMLRQWLTIATKRGIQRAKKVIAVSEATRQDILTYYDTISPNTVIAIHHGVHERFKPLDTQTIEAVKKKYKIDKEFILCLGTLQRRKNVPRLIQAFHQLKHQHQIPHKLVLVGQKYSDLPENEIFQTIEQLFLKKEIIWTGYIEEQDVPGLMNGAEVFVFPSLYEGFGMPVLEAMACGVPVACSKTSSLPEVVGKSGLMFDPYNVDDIAKTIYQLLTNQDLRITLKEKGPLRAKQFSWESCAQKTLEVLESVGKD